MPFTISKHRPLWILIAGFALVIGSLALAAWFGFRQANLIRKQAAALVEEHRFTAHLVDDLALEQHRASTLLLAASRSSLYPAGRAEKELKEFEDALPAIAREGTAVLPSPLWEQLTTEAKAYGAALRQALAQRAEAKADVLALQARYDAFIEVTDQILIQDSLHAADVEGRIEQESVELTNKAGGLLITTLLLAVLCAAATIRFTLGALRRMRQQDREINRVSWHLIKGQEESARRFSHEMHDELGQSLTGLKAMLMAVKPEEFTARRADCLSLLDEAIGNVRELSQLLRPVILDDFGLDAALRWLAERFQQRTRIEVEVNAALPQRLADEVETHLFRITQEALTNVARHAGASRVDITLEQREADIWLTITDNGGGLPRKTTKAPSLGLIGMRARAEQLGGTFALSDSTPHGVCVSICVPARLAQEALETQEETYA